MANHCRNVSLTVKNYLLFGFLLLVMISNSHILLANQDLLTVIDTTEVIQDTVVLIEDNLQVEPSEQEIGIFQKIVHHKATIWILLVCVLLMGLVKPLTNIVEGLKQRLDAEPTLSPGQEFDIKEQISEYSATRSVLKYLSPILLVAFLIYVAIAGTQMEGYAKEWMNLLVRWAHIVAGIMWIGASFYFVFLENNLNRTNDVRDELAGNLWAVHGGGFYFLEKYKVAPKVIPKDLHWFKYEAYFTFLTGILLLAIVYYLDAKAYLIDSSLADISVIMAIGISMSSIIVAWGIYDLMCRSALVRHEWAFLLCSIVLFTGFAYFFTHVYNSRAAYIHMGAIIGAIMVGNVFFNIIPAQKAMVRAAMVGEPLDASLGVKAGQRSLHNNYFTLPVLFIMISNHFPSTYGHAYNWLVLIVISIASAGIKHFWNLADKGRYSPKILVISLVALFSLIVVISPIFEEKMSLAIPVEFAEANQIIQTRCIQCHSASPTDDVWKSAPNGVMYDTPEQIQNMADKILIRAVRSKNMPQGNKTNMTEDERNVLKRWILQGAKID